MAYIGGGHTYYHGSEQRHTQAPFLLLAYDHAAKQLHACVRWVALRQFGHFMMGRANVGGTWITVSGAYGSDGLPMDWDKLTPRAREFFTPVPGEIAAVYWKGDGHNSAGREYPTMREWARQNLLRRKD